MRKQYWFVLGAAMLMSTLTFGAAAAQDKVALTLGETVEGEITEEVNEVMYSFSGTAGQIITIEALPITSEEASDQLDLDPTITLQNADGEQIAYNDDFSYPIALLIAELPDDGDYVVVIGRSGGAEGSTVGQYSVTVKEPEFYGQGSTINADISTDFLAAPQVFIIDPAVSGPVEFTFSQEIGEDYAGMRIVKFVDEYYPESVANLDSTGRVSKAVITVDLEAGNYYAVQLTTVSFSFGDTTDFPVTVEIK